jgi:hypothetical protein
MGNKGYPFRREGWMYSYDDDFHFTSLLWNTYVLYLEYYQVAPNYTWEDFCRQLSHEVLQSIKV